MWRPGQIDGMGRMPSNELVNISNSNQNIQMYMILKVNCKCFICAINVLEIQNTSRSSVPSVIKSVKRKLDKYISTQLVHH